MPQIRLDDWKRILLGDAPPSFLLEVLGRSVIIFIALLVLMRLLGKRMNAQLSATEMAVVLTLGAIAANGMQIPQRGLLQAIFVLFCAFLFQRGLTWGELKSARVESLATGTASMLVKDGVLQTDELKETRVSRDQLFAQLRSRGLLNLGQVKRVYLEGCGSFSLFAREKALPGLSLLPVVDAKMGARRPVARGVRACKNCGWTQEASQEQRCPNCWPSEWDMAVI